MLSLAPLALMTGVGFSFLPHGTFSRCDVGRIAGCLLGRFASIGHCPATLAGSKADSFALTWTELVQSVFIFKGRWAKFPATLTDNGVGAYGTSLAERLESLFSCCLRALMIWIDLARAHTISSLTSRGRKTVFRASSLDCHEHRLSHVCAETFNQI